MARPKSWTPRIAHILGYLEADGTECYKRGEVEKLFDISASQAKELMAVAGAKAGPELTVSRSNLLHYLKNSHEGQGALIEIERRKKLAKRLRDAEENLKLRGIRLKASIKDAEWTRFEDLPNVSIQAGLLQVAFTPGDAIDLLDTLFRFIKAVGNDLDAFEGMCAPAAAPDLAPPETAIGAGRETRP